METVNKKIPASFVALCVQRFLFSFSYHCFLFLVDTGVFFFLFFFTRCVCNDSELSNLSAEYTDR